MILTASEQLALHGYLLVNCEPEGCHVLYSPDHGDPGARIHCICATRWTQAHLLPGLLAGQGWPTRPLDGWSCPFHGGDL